MIYLAQTPAKRLMRVMKLAAIAQYLNHQNDSYGTANDLCTAHILNEYLVRRYVKSKAVKSDYKLWLELNSFDETDIELGDTTHSFAAWHNTNFITLALEFEGVTYRARLNYQSIDRATLVGCASSQVLYPSQKSHEFDSGFTEPDFMHVGDYWDKVRKLFKIEDVKQVRYLLKYSELFNQHVKHWLRLPSF